jgi:hypothetical protein
MRAFVNARWKMKKIILLTMKKRDLRTSKRNSMNWRYLRSALGATSRSRRSKKCYKRRVFD